MVVYQAHILGVISMGYSSVIVPAIPLGVGGNSYSFSPDHNVFGKCSNGAFDSVVHSPLISSSLKW